MKFKKLNHLKRQKDSSISLVIFSSILFKFFVCSKFIRFIKKKIPLKNIEKFSAKWNKQLNFCSFFQISQFYLVQNFFGVHDFRNYFLFISNKILKSNLILKFTDVILQSFFGKVILFLKNSKDLLRPRDSKSIEIKIKQKWNFIIPSIQTRTFFSKKNLESIVITTHNHPKCSEKFLIKPVFHLDSLYHKLWVKMQKKTQYFKRMNICKNFDVFFSNLFIHGDVFLGVLFKEIIKFCKLEKFNPKICFKSFFTMLFDHFNTDLIYNILFSKLQIPQSFVYEKLNFIETKIISRKNKISKLKNFKTFISRGFFFRVIKINQKYTRKFLYNINYQNEIKENFFSRSEGNYFNIFYSNFNFLKIEKNRAANFLFFSVFEKLWFLFEKITLIIISKGKIDKKHERFMNFFITIMNVILKKFRGEKKTELFSNILMLLPTSVNPFNSNYTKKFYLVSLISFQLNELNISLHEFLFSKDMVLLKTKIYPEPKLKKKKIFDQNFIQCQLTLEIKKMFLKKNQEMIFNKQVLKFEIQKKEPNKRKRLVNIIVDKLKYLELKFLTNQRLKKICVESYISLLLFSMNKVGFLFKKINNNGLKNEKNLTIKFYHLKNGVKRKAYGICIFCLKKKKKRILDSLKIIAKNFEKLKNSDHTIFKSFSIFLAVFKFSILKMNKVKENSRKNSNQSKVFVSKKNISLKKSRFPDSKALCLRKFLKEIEHNLDENVTSSLFQNSFFFFKISLNNKTLFFIKNLLQITNSFKNKFSKKTSWSLTSLVEFIIHKKKETLSEIVENNLEIKNFTKSSLEYHFSKFKFWFLKEINFFHYFLIRNFNESILGSKVIKKKNLYLKILLDFKKYQGLENDKKKSITKKKYSEKYFPVFKKFSIKNIHKRMFKRVFFLFFQTIIKFFLFKTYCEASNCNFNSKFDFYLFLEHPTQFLCKINSRVFYKMASRLNSILNFSKKKIILLKKFFWKYNLWKLFDFKLIEKTAKIYREFIHLRNTNKNLFLSIFFFLICIFKKLNLLIGSGGKKFSELCFTNFSLIFLPFNFFLWVFNIVKKKKKKIDFFQKNTNIFLNIFLLFKDSSRFYLLFQNIKLLKYSIKIKSILFDLHSTPLKNIKKNLLVFRQKMNCSVLIIAKFIYSTKKIILETLTHLIIFKTKGNDTSLNLKWLYGLSIKKCSSPLIKWKIDFMIIILIFQICIKLFDFSKWIYHPKLYLFKESSILYNKHLIKLFKRKKGTFFKKTYLNSNLNSISVFIPFVFKKKNLKKTIKFYNNFYWKIYFDITQIQKNIKEVKKYQKNKNLILKKKNFGNLRLSHTDFLNSKKNFILFYFLNTKIKSSSILKNFYKILLNIVKSIPFQLENFIGTNFTEYDTKKSFRFSKIRNSSFNFFKLFFNILSLHLFFLNENYFFKVNRFNEILRINSNKNKKFSCILIIYNCLSNLKNRFLQKKALKKVLNLDLLFAVHMHLKAIKKRKIYEKFEIFVFINILFENQEKKIYFLENFYLIQFSKENRQKNTFQTFTLFKAIIFYKRAIMTILIKKYTSLKKIKRIFEEFFNSIFHFKKKIQKKFAPKLYIFGVYFKNLLSSNNLKIQFFCTRLLKKLMDLKLPFFFNGYLLIKLLFTEFFSIIFYKKSSYITFLKLFEKNYISLSYLGNILKLLFYLLKLKKKLIQKNCQVIICFLILFSEMRICSRISNVLKFKLRENKYFTEFSYKNSFLFLFFTISSNRFNLHFFGKFFKGCSINLSETINFDKRYYDLIFFLLFYERTEKNRINFLFKHDLTKNSCVCFKKKSKKTINWFLGFKNLIKIKKLTCWYNTIKCFNLYLKNSYLSFNFKMVNNFFFFKTIFLILNEINYGNIIPFSNFGKYIKLMKENFIPLQNKLLENSGFQLISRKIFYLECYPSIFFYNLVTNDVNLLGNSEENEHFITPSLELFSPSFKQIITDISWKIYHNLLKKCRFLRYVPCFINYKQSESFFLPFITSSDPLKSQSELFLIKRILTILNS